MRNLVGYIKLYRSLQNWGWYHDSNTLHVFIDLLITANFYDAEFMGITIHRGEVATSYPSLAQNTGLTIKKVRTAIKHLEKTQEVAVKKYSKFSVISIKNYDRFQQEGSQRAVKGQAEGSQRAVKGHQSNNIELQEEREYPPYSPPTDDPAAARAVGAAVSGAEEESVIDRVMHGHIGATDF